MPTRFKIAELTGLKCRQTGHLDDEPRLRSYLADELIFGIKKKLDDVVLLAVFIESSSSDPSRSRMSRRAPTSITTCRRRKRLRPGAGWWGVTQVAGVSFGISFLVVVVWSLVCGKPLSLGPGIGYCFGAFLLWLVYPNFPNCLGTGPCPNHKFLYKHVQAQVPYCENPPHVFLLGSPKKQQMAGFKGKAQGMQPLTSPNEQRSRTYTPNAMMGGCSSQGPYMFWRPMFGEAHCGQLSQGKCRLGSRSQPQEGAAACLVVHTILGRPF